MSFGRENENEKPSLGRLLIITVALPALLNVTELFARAKFPDTTTGDPGIALEGEMDNVVGGVASAVTFTIFPLNIGHAACILFTELLVRDWQASVVFGVNVPGPENIGPPSI